jgi:hypothetical protein
VKSYVHQQLFIEKPCEVWHSQSKHRQPRKKSPQKVSKLDRFDSSLTAKVELRNF